MRKQKVEAGLRAYHAGRSAEECVLRRYKERGAKVVSNRMRNEGGEIDLVLRDGAQFVFVEVKQSKNFARAALHLTSRQIARLFACAEVFLGTQPGGLLNDVRFDLALVDGTGDVEILENALIG